jgi:hypothetical protein
LPTADLPAVFLSWLPSSVVANSHSNNQLSFAQSPVAIRHSLLAAVFPRPADLPTADLPAVFVVAAVFRRG